MILKPTQRQGVDFLKTPLPSGKPHKCLASEPGTGKTVQVCVAIAELALKSGFIICPDSYAIKRAWYRHLTDWAGVNPSEIFIVQSSRDAIPTSAKWIILGYAMLNYKEIVRQIATQFYDVAVIDEAHRLKSQHSKRSHTVLTRHGNSQNALISRAWHKWLLSGTLMPNRPAELYPVLKTLCPELIAPYGDWERFGMRYCGARFDGYAYQFNGASNIDELREKIAPFIMRHRLEDAPEILEDDLYIDIGGLLGGSDESNTADPTLRKEIGLASFPYIQEYLNYVAEEYDDEKFIVFAYHRDVIGCFTTGPSYAFLFGGQNQKEKDLQLKRFIEDPKCRFIIIQHQAGGESLDGLQTVCNRIILAEPDWSGGGWEQQIGRCRRIGQPKDKVYVTNLIVEGTRHETIVASRRRKLYTSDKLLNQYVYREPETIMSMEEVLGEIRDELRALRGVISGLPVATQVAPAAEKPTAPKSAAKNGKKPAVATEVADSTPVQRTAVIGTVVDEQLVGGVTRDMVKQAATKVVMALGNNDATREQIKRVMGIFGVNTLAELQEANFAEAIRLYGQLERGETLVAEPAKTETADLGI